MPFKAKISQSSPRYCWWMKVFGTDEVFVISSKPQIATVENREREIYLLDLEALPKEVYDNLVSFLSEQFHILPPLVRRDLNTQGCPILAEDITVSQVSLCDLPRGVKRPTVW